MLWDFIDLYLQFPQYFMDECAQLLEMRLLRHERLQRRRVQLSEAVPQRLGEGTRDERVLLRLDLVHSAPAYSIFPRDAAPSACFDL